MTASTIGTLRDVLHYLEQQGEIQDMPWELIHQLRHELSALEAEFYLPSF